ncbi:MAG: hypothetical protein KDB03_25840, partial [Planctomycetales bacterium]|nr:hypothetical protein [Planctomycetales bacterium]
VLQDSNEQKQRLLLASAVSRRNLQTVKPDVGSPTVFPLEPPMGWSAMETQLQVRLRACEILLRKNGYLSARQEANEAAIFLIRHLDQMRNRFYSEPLFAQANVALDEAEDFTTYAHTSTDPSFLHRLVESHQTSVISPSAMDGVSPLLAAQHYRQYAMDCLLASASQHPWMSDIYYAIGRVYQAQSMADQEAPELLRWRAMVYFRAAFQVLPSNALAANQLGFMLLQLDRPQEAREALVASYTAQATLPALENLIEVSRRLNDNATYQWALKAHASMRQASPPRNGPEYVVIDPDAFAAISPPGLGPK